MNRKTILLTILVIPVLISACVFTVVRGSGDVVSETREVSNFDKVELSGVGTIYITQGDEEALEIEAEDNLLRYIKSSVRGSTLVIGFEDDQWTQVIQPTEPIKYFLTLKDITKIELSGAGRVIAEQIETTELRIVSSGAGDIQIDNLSADDLIVDLSGAGNCEIGGQVTDQQITISGAGNYSAESLETEATSIQVSGMGSSEVWANDALNIEISGAGNVKYYGSPHVSQEISGVGNIRRIGER